MYFIYTYYYSIHSKQNKNKETSEMTFWHNTGRWQYFTFKLF